METLSRLGMLPMYVLQGSADDRIHPGQTRAWAEEMVRLGIPHEYIEVPGGDHSLLISRSSENIGRVFGFFDAARKTH
jgi:dipeptidyl aminopeptidase/acylaminoacyl peptidase